MNNNQIVIHLVTTEEKFSQLMENCLKDFSSQKRLETNSNNFDENEELLTIEQLAKFFQVSETTIHNWKNDGTLPYIKVKSRIRFKKSQVLSLYEKRRKGHRR